MSTRRLRNGVAARLWDGALAAGATGLDGGDATVERSPVNPYLSLAQEQIVRRLAPARSFADIGCMWQIAGAVSFLAEASGATRVTAFDAMDPSAEFVATHSERSSKVAFVQGDLHMTEDVSAVTPHDVVWCTGLMYHSPFPALAIENLARIASDHLVVGNKSIPEVPGVPQACVFFPGLASAERERYARLFGDAIRNPYRRGQRFRAWWWGITPSLMRAMVNAMDDFDVIEEIFLPRSHTFDDHLLIARRIAG